jgi:hypothetical protein
MAGRCIVRCRFALLFVLGLAITGPQQAVAQSCPGEHCDGDFNCDGQVTIDEIMVSVSNALNGCREGISRDQACTDFAAAQCTKLDQCVVNGTTSRYGGVAICQARQKEACLARLNAPGTGNNPSDVELCTQQLPTASCTDFDLGNVPECLAKVGTRENGQPCAFPGQCQSSICAIATGTNCGTCAMASQSGESCATTSCSHGFACVKDTQCQPLGTSSSPCDANHPCGAGLSCVTPSGAQSGTCETAGSSVGTPCDPQHQTAPACDPNVGLYCDGTTRSCLAVTYTLTGGACGFVSPIVVHCTNDSTCFGALGQTPGLCAANAVDGAHCDTQLGPSCLPPAQCVTGSASATAGTCQLPDAAACG